MRAVSLIEYGVFGHLVVHGARRACGGVGAKEGARDPRARAEAARSRAARGEDGGLRAARDGRYLRAVDGDDRARALGAGGARTRARAAVEAAAGEVGQVRS